jgi:hypothetical protein
MVWIAASFLCAVYILLGVLRRKFTIPMTFNLWLVIVLSLSIGSVIYVVPRAYAARIEDASFASFVYITNNVCMGIMLCGTLLGCIAQAANEWGVERRAKRQPQRID